MRCSNCGTENAEGLGFCGHCGAALPSPAPGQGQFYGIAPPRHPPAKSRTSWIVILAVVAVAAIVMIAVFIALLLSSGPDLEIANWTPTNAMLSVIFTVSVANRGDHSNSATILCTVTFGNGDSYNSSKAITLGPSESSSYVVAVTIPSSHWTDVTGEYSCTLV